MGKASEQDVLGVAQGLADSEEVVLQVGDGGNQARDFPGASQNQSTASQPAKAGADDEDQGGSPQDAGKVDDPEDAADSDDLSDEEVEAIKELRDFLREEARKEVSEEIVPKLQSTYDRQIAQLNRQIQNATAAAQAREKELLDAVREAKLNGLTDAEKSQLKQQWDFEDARRAMDEQAKELEAYHVELLREAYAQEYAEFGLTADDLAEFETPEDMADFVQEVQLEFYKQLAELRASGAVQAEEEPKPKAKTRTAPAGAAAPSDAGGGAAVPSPKVTPQGTGTQVMRDILAGNDGWESVKLR